MSHGSTLTAVSQGTRDLSCFGPIAPGFPPLAQAEQPRRRSPADPGIIDRVKQTVRPAIPADAPAFAALQRRTMVASLEAALGSNLPSIVPQALANSNFESTWQQAIAQQTQNQLAFVAQDDDVVRGFAAIAILPAEALDGQPAEGKVVAGAREGGVVVDISSLAVDPDHARQGHGSRLLAAIADTAKAFGQDTGLKPTEMRVWLIAGDDSNTQFFNGAGFAPKGLRRSYDVAGQEVIEHLWWAELD